MSLKPFLHLWRNGQLSALLGVGAELKSFYKLTYLAAAGEAGLLTGLRPDRRTLNRWQRSSQQTAGAGAHLRRGFRWAYALVC